jgi:hypothetical protein
LSQDEKNRIAPSGTLPADSKTGDDDIIDVEAVGLRRDGRKVYGLITRDPQAVVIHCGDPRFQSAFHRFITEELGFSSYTPIIIGGGIHAFGVQSLLPKNFKILWEQIKFAIKDGRAKQVIIINHEDCHWYEKMKGYHTKIQLPLKGKLDLQTATETILRDFAGVQVRTFWAGLEDDGVVFTEVKS